MLTELAAERACIKELETRILELERSLSALRAEKASAQERLDSYKYPVSTLPNELVSEIFIHFLPAFPSPPPFGGPFSPTLLTQICQKWRRIALSTPSLWKAIGFSGYDARALAPIRIWLSRSSCAPLSITVWERPSGPDISEALTALLAHRTHWEQAAFHMRPSHLSTIGSPMPLLRRLHLSLNIPSSSIVTFSDTPMLRTVVLNFCAARSIIMPWDQLTSLTVTQILPREWEPILQQTKNLVHCKLDVAEITGEPPVADTRLPCLRSLTITDVEGLNGCLESFIVSALRRLEVPEQFLGSNPTRTLASFISKSRCQLREVRITGEISVPMESYRQEFGSIPTFSFEWEDNEEASASGEI
ncbi:hypothetical protein DFH06DRAFT_438729 [Mycena polygramma]|nr:hypothetical protein DFH06DRAFT_438729 [Mycena polygramma]